MAILIDPPVWPAHGTSWSHLISDSNIEELHEFAERLGVPRRGFDIDHYDVPAVLYDRALTLGATAVTAKQAVGSLRESNLRVRSTEREAMRPILRREYLQEEWSSLGNKLGRGGKEDTTWPQLGTTLLNRWSEPHRNYHDARHLEDILLALNHFKILGESIAPSTLLAAWFHDSVYHSAPGTDEVESARLAATSLAAVGLDLGLAQEVGAFIEATVPAAKIVDPPIALAYLLDADLSIFGASESRYAEYSEAIRSEFIHQPDPEYADSRSGALSEYLERPSIYRSDVAQSLWEERARTNLTAEVARLRGEQVVSKETQRTSR